MTIFSRHLRRVWVAFGCAILLLAAAATLLITVFKQSDIDEIFFALDRANSPGCAVGVYRRGEVIYSKSYGMANMQAGVPITADTVFDIASNTKQFTAFAIHTLVRRKALSLDDDVRKYVPELPQFSNPIKIRHLLHNTSGLYDLGDLLELTGSGIDRPVNRGEFFQKIAKLRTLNFVPGERYMYSNTNWILLGITVERVDGRSFGAFMREEVFAPLGMTNTQVRANPSKAIPNRAIYYTPLGNGTYLENFAWGRAENIPGMAFINTTIADLARWDASFYQEEVYKNGITEDMYAPGQLNSGESSFYASGLMRGQYLGLPALFHGGQGGGSSDLIRFHEEGISVAVLCNQYHTHTDSRSLAVQVARQYVDERESSNAITSESATPEMEEDINRYAGLYWIREQARRARFVVQDGILTEVSDGDKYPLSSLGDGRFQDDYELIAFEPDGKGGEGVQRATGERYTLARWPDEFGVGDDLADYLGDYYSPDLDYVWSIAVVNRELILRRKKSIYESLTPAVQDLFTLPGLLLQFERGEQGNISHLLASTDRAIDIKFEKNTKNQSQ